MSEPIMYGGNPDYVLGLQKHNGRLARRIKELEDAIRQQGHSERCGWNMMHPCTCLMSLLPKEDDR